MKATIEPRRIATPNNIYSMPRDIGWRLILKNPEITKEVAFSCGFTVVFTFLNKLSVIIFITHPKN